LNVRHRIAFTVLLAFASPAFSGSAVAQSVIAAAVAKPVSLPDIAIGSANAPITITEYSSMSCPHCAAFGQNVFPMLRSKYIDTGKVFYVFRVYPIGAPDGVAEKLARCMPKAKYFPFMDQLFRSQQSWDPEYGVQDVRGAMLLQARTAGMSESQFDTCVADTKLDSVINKVAADGAAKYNITGTPTLIVDGKVVSPGMVPSLEQMRSSLDAALAGKS